MEKNSQVHFSSASTEEQYPVNSLKHSGSYMCRLLLHSINLHFAHRVYLWVSYDSQDKQRLFS
jgi:hypothetical protein